MHQESQKKIRQSRNNRESIADPDQRWGARSNGGVDAACPVLVEIGGAQVWRGVPALWFTMHFLMQ